MTMIVKDGFLICGRRPCVACMGDGTLLVQHACDDCEGIGEVIAKIVLKEDFVADYTNEICKSCRGGGRVHGPEREDCGRCHNEDPLTHDQATLYDTILDNVFDKLKYVVYRNQGTYAHGFNEKLVGMGYIACVMDCGVCRDLTDLQLIETVKSGMLLVQAVKVARPVNKDTTRGILCDHVAIITHKQGYNVQAVWQKVRT